MGARFRTALHAFAMNDLTQILNRADGNAPAVERTIRQYYAAMANRDVQKLGAVLDKKFMIVEADRTDARVALLDSGKSSDLLPPQGNHDWDDLQVSSVKIEISSTHPSVAVASFTLIRPLSAKSVAGLQAALDAAPAEFDASQRKALAQRIADRAIHFSEFAMLARRDGRWKIVTLSVPR